MTAKRVRTLATRDCCGTTYDLNHTDDCPIRGIAAVAALPCAITVDGWCFNHSTGAGAVYCDRERADP
jgi:hypothetical protein